MSTEWPVFWDALHSYFKQQRKAWRRWWWWWDFLFHVPKVLCHSDDFLLEDFYNFLGIMIIILLSESSLVLSFQETTLHSAPQLPRPGPVSRAWACLGHWYRKLQMWVWSERKCGWSVILSFSRKARLNVFRPVVGWREEKNLRKTKTTKQTKHAGRINQRTI